MIEELNFETFYEDMVNSMSDTLPAEFFTLQQFAKDAELSENTARRRLQKLVMSGVLETRLATVDGYQSRIYWRGEE